MLRARRLLCYRSPRRGEDFFPLLQPRPLVWDRREVDVVCGLGFVCHICAYGETYSYGNCFLVTNIRTVPGTWPGIFSDGLPQSKECVDGSDNRLGKFLFQIIEATRGGMPARD
eukprot:SAG25_NODE_1642_length_2636_cov_1.243595_1_plen_113_part_10